MPHLEKDLRQMRKIERHGSERARQRSDVPKIQHCGRHEDTKTMDDVDLCEFIYFFFFFLFIQ